MSHDHICCTPKGLDPALRLMAAENAIRINPMNRAPVERLIKVLPDLIDLKPFTALLTSKRWHTDGVDLSVSFMEARPAEFRDRVLGHMNAWGETAKVRFRETTGTGQVRIAFAIDGHWSYLGTDVLQIDTSQPTMNLQAFTMTTPDSEFYRVVRHETGHTLGFPHEHMRGELVAKIDREKAITYYMATQGWSREEVIQQVLTPIDESSIMGTARADPRSIMCYQIPGSLTTDGQPIPGGSDIDAFDREFVGQCYPKHA